MPSLLLLAANARESGLRERHSWHLQLNHPRCRLDAGEYDAVRKRIEIHPHSTIKRGGNRGFDLVGAGFEVAFEALLTVLFEGLL